MKDTLVIIPTYNEAANIGNMIAQVFAQSAEVHVLVIDDGSPDGTAGVIESLQPSYTNRLHLIKRDGKQGLGTAYISGFRWALERSYQFIFEMDADFSHPPEKLGELYAACANNGFDVAIGSRYVRGGSVKNWPVGRILMSYFASVYVQLITWMPVKDTTAGFICYRRKVLETIDLNKIKFIGYAFQIEMKFASWKLGFKIKEVPICFTDRQKGESKMSKGIFKEAVTGVWNMKWNSFASSYRKAEATASS